MVNFTLLLILISALYCQEFNNAKQVKKINCHGINIGNNQDTSFHHNIINNGNKVGGFDGFKDFGNGQIFLIDLEKNTGPTVTKIHFKPQNHPHLNARIYYKFDNQSEVIDRIYVHVNYSCDPLLSTIIPIAMEIEFDACPFIDINWKKVCRSGYLEDRKGLAISLKRSKYSADQIVYNGGIPDPAKVSIIVEKHEPEVTLYFHQDLIKQMKIISDESISQDKVEEIATEFEFNLPITIESPVIRFNEDLLYPNLKGEVAKGSSITQDFSELTLEFNCLGIEGKDNLELIIPIPNFNYISIVFHKKCSKETLLDKIEEEIVEEEKYFGFFKSLLILLVFGLVIIFLGTIYRFKEAGVSFCEALFLPIKVKNFLNKLVLRIKSLIWIEQEDGEPQFKNYSRKKWNRNEFVIEDEETNREDGQRYGTIS